MRPIGCLVIFLLFPILTYSSTINLSTQQKIADLALENDEFPYIKAGLGESAIITTTDSYKSKRSRTPPSKYDRCSRVCSMKSNSLRMNTPAICTSTGKFYDAKSTPSFNCDKCKGHVELDRKRKYKKCVGKRSCVEKHWYSWC